MREKEKDIGLKTSGKSSLVGQSRECQAGHNVWKQKVWMEPCGCSQALRGAGGVTPASYLPWGEQPPLAGQLPKR